MGKTSVDDKARINNMIENIDFCTENIKDITEDNFIKDIKIQYALCMSLQIICENANHISLNTKLKDSSIEWSTIKSMRNIISHEYGALNMSSVYDTIKQDLPDLKIKLEVLYNKLTEENKKINNNKNEGKENGN